MYICAFVYGNSLFDISIHVYGCMWVVYTGSVLYVVAQRYQRI